MLTSSATFHALGTHLPVSDAPFVGNTPMGLVNDHDAYCVRLSRAGKLDQLATAGFFAKVGLTASSTTRDPLLQFGLGVPVRAT